MNVPEILSYGVIGLGFLLALLAYRLLSREQKKSEPRKQILTSIYVFMLFSITLCIVGFGSEYYTTKKNEELIRIKSELTGLLTGKGTLLALLQNDAEGKEQLMRIDSDLKKLVED